MRRVRLGQRCLPDSGLRRFGDGQSRLRHRLGAHPPRWFPRPHQLQRHPGRSGPRPHRRAMPPTERLQGNASNREKAVQKAGWSRTTPSATGEIGLKDRDRQSLFRTHLVPPEESYVKAPTTLQSLTTEARDRHPRLSYAPPCSGCSGPCGRRWPRSTGSTAISSGESLGLA